MHRHTRSLTHSLTHSLTAGLGALAAAAAVCVMIPMDTVKTRLVLQGAAGEATYAGVRDCFYRIFREEGLGAFYISLLPRLASVVPMISIQFGAYEVRQSSVYDVM